MITKENIIEYIYYCVGAGANAVEFDVCSGDNGELALRCNSAGEEMSGFTLRNAFDILENMKSIYIKCCLSEYYLEDQLMELVKKYPKMRRRIIISKDTELQKRKKKIIV